MSTPKNKNIGDEADAVDILINALKRDDLLERRSSRNSVGIGRVSFDYQEVGPNTTKMPTKHIRTSLTIPNAPINKDHQTLLDTLADLACSKSPVRTNAGNCASRAKKHWRPRAMSEPWIVDEFHPLSTGGSRRISKSGEKADAVLFPVPFLVMSNATSIEVPGPAPLPLPLTSPTIELQTSVPEPVPCLVSAVPVPVGIAAWASRKMNVNSITSLPLVGSLSSASSQCSAPILPQILDGDYSTVYNKNGRIGIYTKEERQSIISRFQDKRRTRVWKKKIRYHCRKDLADRRIRIKGRFVRAASSDGSPHPEGSFDSGPNSIKSVSEIEVEAEAEGLTSSEEGEAEMESHPMEVVEASSESSPDYSIRLEDTDTERDRESDGQQVGAGIASSGSGSSIRVKNRGKQNQAGGESSSQGSVLMGSAAEGMKAFWGAIHDTSSSSSLKGSSTMDTSASATSNCASETLEEVESGGSSSNLASSTKDKSGFIIVDDEVDDDSGDEAHDLWDENGELLHDESGSKKRFRRHTIAY